MNKIKRTIGGSNSVEVNGVYIGRLEHVQYPGQSVSYYHFYAQDSFCAGLSIGFRTVEDFYSYFSELK